MKENYMKLKTFSTITAIAGAVFMMMGGIVKITPTSYRDLFGSVTAANLLASFVLVLGSDLLITALVCLFLPKTITSSCSYSTSAVSLCIALFVALGAFCLIDALAILATSPSAHPIEYPMVIIFGMVSLMALFVLIAVYPTFRNKKRSLKGILLDAFTAVIYCPVFFYAILFAFCLLDNDYSI